MKEIIKYCICFQFEKLHRKVFDKYYFPYEDSNYHKLNVIENFILNIYKILCKILYNDWREYLNMWSIKYKNKYVRYKKYS